MDAALEERKRSSTASIPQDQSAVAYERPQLKKFVCKHCSTPYWITGFARHGNRLTLAAVTSSDDLGTELFAKSIERAPRHEAYSDELSSRDRYFQRKKYNLQRNTHCVL